MMSSRFQNRFRFSSAVMILFLRGALCTASEIARMMRTRTDANMIPGMAENGLTRGCRYREQAQVGNGKAR